jgi:hypothetical protein
LIKCENLREIKLDFNIYSYHVPVIRLLDNLQSLTLGQPSRAVLAQIGPWIEKFTRPLQNLCISVNDHPFFVGSLYSFFVLQNGTKVEPETILPLIPSFRNLKRFALGRGHKLSRTNLLRVVANMPNIESLDLFYDNFIIDVVGHAPCHFSA